MAYFKLISHVLLKAGKLNRADDCYTPFSTTCFQGQPITVRPVPNKVQADVPIKARDLDHAGNPVTFSIASSTCSD